MGVRFLKYAHHAARRDRSYKMPQPAMHALEKMLFPVLSHLMCAGFSYTIQRPQVPYALGLRLIHTPESVLLLRLKPDFLSLFRMTESSSPTFFPSSNYSSVRFNLQHSHDEKLAGLMLTSRRDESNFVIFRKDSPICVMQLSVAHDGHAGHVLRCAGQLYGDCTLWKMQLHIIVTGLVLETLFLCALTRDHINIGQTVGAAFTGSSMSEEDANLSHYRSNVLKLR